MSLHIRDMFVNNGEYVFVTRPTPSIVPSLPEERRVCCAVVTKEKDPRGVQMYNELEDVWVRVMPHYDITLTHCHAMNVYRGGDPVGFGIKWLTREMAALENCPYAV